jgi:hypothetical protein
MTENENSNNQSVILPSGSSSTMLPEMYHDALQPAAREVSKGFHLVAKTINMVLTPLELTVYGFEKFKDKVATSLAKKHEKSDIEDIVQPPINIMGPAIEALKYTGDCVELSGLFINLLYSSTHKERVGNAHPAFIEVIKQLSPDEAHLLTFISKLDTYPMICEVSSFVQESHLSTITPEFIKIAERVEGVDYSMLIAYKENLERLKLIEVVSSSVPKIAEVNDSNMEDSELTKIYFNNLLHESIWVSEFGALFVKACIR